MELVEETYGREKMSITCNHLGNLGTKEFNHIPCRLCDEIVLPEVKEKHKFDKSTSATNIMGSWDTKKISVKRLDMAGCFFPCEKHVHAGPNGRRLIVRPTLHELCDEIKNPKTQPATATQAESTTQTVTTTQTLTTTQAVSTIQTVATDECDVTITINKHGSLTLNRVCTNANGDKVSLGKKTRDSEKFTNVNKLLDPKITLNAKSTDKADVWSKEFMLKVSFVSMLFVSNCSQSSN